MKNKKKGKDKKDKEKKEEEGKGKDEESKDEEADKIEKEKDAKVIIVDVKAEAVATNWGQRSRLLPTRRKHHQPLMIHLESIHSKSTIIPYADE